MITDIKTLALKHGIQEVSLPGWGSGEEFVCRMRRPTLMEMAATGAIPNPLLGAVRALFQAERKKLEETPLDEQAKAMVVLAKYALVEPSYAQLQEAGVSLTDGQLMTIYAYAIGGAAALEPFRRLLRGGTGEPVNAVPATAEPTDEA